MTAEQDDLKWRFAVLAGQVTRRWRRILDRQLQPFGLSEATWRPLLHLSRSAVPMRQKELANSLGLDGSSVVRLLDALQAANLIERREEEADRRARAITLTTNGYAAVAQVEAISRQVRSNALAGLSDEEIKTAYRVLVRIDSNLTQDTDSDAP